MPTVKQLSEEEVSDSRIKMGHICTTFWDCEEGALGKTHTLETMNIPVRQDGKDLLVT